LTNYARQKKLCALANRQEERMNNKMAIYVLCAVAVAIPNLTRADEAPTTPAQAPATAPAAATDYKQMYEEQKKRNDELEKRISLLEEKDKSSRTSKGRTYRRTL